jgi:hypothetical protein
MLAGSPPYQAEDTRKLESLIRSRRPPRALPARCPVALRAIAMKALAPDAARRYRSAREFQADLQAFLENKPVRAELERRHAWNAGATMECLRRATRTVVKIKRHLQLLGGAGWFLLGMALWIGATLAWRATAPEPLLPMKWPAIQAPGAPAFAFIKPVPEAETTADPPPSPPKKAHKPAPKAKPRRPRRWR